MSGTRDQRAGTGVAYSVGMGARYSGAVRDRNGTSVAAATAAISTTLSRSGSASVMFGSSILAGSVITRMTATGHTYRSDAFLPTRPTTASSTHRSWCCQVVGDTATATQPVRATASRSCPSCA